MAEIMKLYRKCGIDVPIRVDHVPTMLGENMKNHGYDAIGRYFAIGYLKGILDATFLLYEEIKTLEKIYVNAEKPIKKVKNFWNHIHFHPTDAIEDLWGQKILDSASKDSAAKMVRMYAMLEDAVSEDENGNLIYDFTDTDIRIDYMVSKGFKLLICMNFLPRAIAKDKNIVSANQRYKGKHIYTSVPSDYRLWQEICEKYVSHLVERYGEKLVSSWYFHCWNEPNCSGYWMSDCEDWEEVTNEYLKLYDFFAEGVK